MVVLKSPLALQSITPFPVYADQLGAKIRGNYQLIGTDITAEELLHMAMMAPELYIGIDSGVFHSNHLMENQIKLELVNQLLGRILLYGTPQFTYQDEVFVTSMLQKIGITDVQAFMHLIKIETDRNQLVTELLNQYFTWENELAQNMAAFTQQKEYGDTVNAFIKNTYDADLFLQDEIFKRIEAAECNNTVYDYNYNYGIGTSAVKGMEPVTWMEQADEIQLVQFRKELLLQSAPAYWQKNVTVVPEQADGDIAKYVAAAVIKTLIQKISYEALQMPERQPFAKDYTGILYGSASELIKQLEQASIGQEQIEQYSQNMRQLYRDELQLVELASQNVSFSTEQKSEWSTVCNSLLLSLLENQRLQKQTAELLRISEKRRYWAYKIFETESKEEAGKQIWQQYLEEEKQFWQNSHKQEEAFLQLEHVLRADIYNSKEMETIIAAAEHVKQEIRTTLLEHMPEEMSGNASENAQAEYLEHIIQDVHKMLSRHIPEVADDINSTAMQREVLKHIGNDEMYMQSEAYIIDKQTDGQTEDKADKIIDRQVGDIVDRAEKSIGRQIKDRVDKSTVRRSGDIVGKKTDTGENEKKDIGGKRRDFINKIIAGWTEGKKNIVNQRAIEWRNEKKAFTSKLANERKRENKSSESEIINKINKQIKAEKALADKTEGGWTEAEKVFLDKGADERTEAEKILVKERASEWTEAEKILADKRAEEQTREEKALADKKISERIEAEKIFADKKASERIEAEKIFADKRTEERTAKEKVFTDKRLREWMQTEEEKAAADKKATEWVEAEKVLADKSAEEQTREEQAAGQATDTWKGENKNFINEMPNMQVDRNREKFEPSAYMVELFHKYAGAENNEGVSIMQNIEFLEQINQHNLQMKELIESQNIMLDNPKTIVVDKAQIRKNALRALENPELVLQEVYREGIGIDTVDMPSEVEKILLLTDQKTRQFYEQIMGYRSTPEEKLEGKNIIAEERDMNASRDIIENQIVNAAFDREEINAILLELLYQLYRIEMREKAIGESLHQQENNLQLTFFNPDTHASGILYQEIKEQTGGLSRQYFQQEKQTDTIEQVSFVYHNQEQMQEDLIDEIKETLKKETIFSTQTIKQETETAVTQKQLQEIKQELIRQNEEVLAQAVNQELKKQVHTISNKVYVELERRLKNEQRRRGY